MLNNTNLVNLVKGIIVENTYELYAGNDTDLQKSLENTELEFSMYTEEDVYDKYRHIVDEYCQMCDNCGEWHLVDDLTSLTYQVVCQECLENEYFTCEICGEINHNDEMLKAFDNYNEFDICICESCKENDSDVEYCAYHERLEYDANNWFITVERYGEVCQEAIDYGDFGTCEGCSCVYHIDDLYYSEYNEAYYCGDCYEENNGVIGGYHSSDFEFMTTNDNRNIGLGFELEVEIRRGFDKMDYAETIYNSVNGIHLEDDCSLNNGFEIITNPMSIEYFEEEFVAEIDTIVEEMAGAYNYDHNSAGFHVHVTKESPEQTQNLACLVEYFKEELTEISDREEGQLKRWAAFYTNGIEKAEFDNAIFNKIKDEISDWPSRYHALNTTNARTNEFRIFRGGMDAREIKARVEICHNFNQYAKHNAIDFDNMPSFLEVATFDKNNYIGEYLEDRYPELCGTMGI